MADQKAPQPKILAFNKWLRDTGEHMGYYQLPSQHVDAVHQMLKRAYNAGIRFEQRQQEPIQVGGVD